MSTCPACGMRLSTGLRSWHCICTNCGYEGSELHVDIIGQARGKALDENAREVALGSLRRSNFRRLLSEIDLLSSGGAPSPERLRLLDVGSAHGWFLELARERYEAVGIEPDKDMMAAIGSKGLTVREGFFPEALAEGELFDIIVFNDVLEHIPDIHATLDACANHLMPGGLLVLNAPNRRGFLYWVSKRLLQLGRPATFERLWQCGFPSPHVHYFDSASIGRLALRHNFCVAQAHRLPSVSAAGLYSRVRYSRKVTTVKAALVSAIVAVAIPALAVLPPDIKVWILRKNETLVSGG